MPPKLLRTAATAVTLLVLTACGGGDDTATDPDPDTNTATETTAEDRGVEVAESGEEAAQVLADAADATLASDTIDVELDLSFDGGAALGSQEVSVASTLDIETGDGLFSVMADGQEDAVTMRVSGDTTWVGGSREEIVDALPEGIEWAEASTADLKEAEVLADVEENLDVIHLLRGATDVEAAGTDEVEGVEVARYRFGIDVEAAAEAAGDRSEGVKKLITFQGDNEPVITGEASIDADGRVRSLDIIGELEATPEEEEATGTSSIVITYGVRMLSFDEPIDVEAPPADETVDISEVPGLLEMIEG